LLALTNLALTDSLPLSSDFFDVSDSAVELFAKSPVPEKLTKMIFDFRRSKVYPMQGQKISYRRYLYWFQHRLQYWALVHFHSLISVPMDLLKYFEDLLTFHQLPFSVD